MITALELFVVIAGRGNRIQTVWENGVKYLMIRHDSKGASYGSIHHPPSAVETQNSFPRPGIFA